LVQKQDIVGDDSSGEVVFHAVETADHFGELRIEVGHNHLEGPKYLNGAGLEVAGEGRKR
jgi:hypothetical protein